MQTDHINSPVKGHIQVIATHKETGETKVLCDQPNMVLNMGAQMLAGSLAGYPQFNIWGVRFGFMNAATTPPVVDKTYSNSFQNYTGDLGSVAVQLLAPATFASNTPEGAGPFTNNVARFQATLIPGDCLETASTGATLTPGTSQIFEIALVQNPAFSTTAGGELVFARTQFTNITLDSAYNLTVVWGIQFTV